MMKKNGFTLAEVLITLAIIGVVATMTLPALMNNTQEQQAITGFKKGINTLTEAIQLSMAIDGLSFANLEDTDVESDDVTTHPSLYAVLANRTSIDRQRSEVGGHPTDTSNMAVFLRDGAVVLYNPTDAYARTENQETLNDGLAKGYPIVYDTNGTKGPNALSNCLGLASGATDDTDDIEECTKKDKRQINDQFGVKLRGGYAIPNGAAARWAFAK